MVRAKSSQSRIKSRKLGPGICASPRKEIVFPKFRGAVVQDQESIWVDDPYYTSCYHKAGRAIAGVAHFLLLKKGIRIEWGTSPRMTWRDAPSVTTEDDEVEVCAPVMAPQRVTHRRTAAPFKTKGCATRFYFLQWAVRE